MAARDTHVQIAGMQVSIEELASLLRVSQDEARERTNRPDEWSMPDVALVAHGLGSSAYDVTASLVALGVNLDAVE